MDTASLRIAINTNDIKSANAELDKLSKTSGNTEKATNQLTRSYASLSNILGTIGVAALTHEFIKISDEMKLLDARLKMVSSSTAEYTAQKKELLGISKETYSSIAEITTLYTKLDPALKSLGATTKDVNNITESFAKGLKLGGANTVEAASATLQFAQAMGSGVLRGEEFNAIAEASPKLMKYLAEGLGVPQTALRKMAMEGELSAGRVSAALLKMTAKINEDFTQIPMTVGMATTNLKTELSVAIEEFDRTTGATKALAETISGLSVDLSQYGTDITTFFVATSKFINDHNTALKTTASLVGGVAAAYYGFIAGGAVIAGIRGVTTAVYGLRAAMIALQASSPILLAISVALGVATAAYLAHDDALEKKNYSTINSIDALVKSHDDLLKKRKEIQSDKFALDKTQKKETAIVDSELKKIEDRLNSIGTARSKNVDKAKKEAEELIKSAKTLEDNAKKLAPVKDKKEKKKVKTEEEKEAEKAAEKARKLDHDLAQSQLSNIQKITDEQKEASLNKEAAEIDGLLRIGEVAKEVYDSTISDVQKLTNEVTEKYNIAEKLFPEGIPQEWFDSVNQKFEDLNELADVKDFEFNVKINGIDGVAKGIADIANGFNDIQKSEMQYEKNKIKYAKNAKALNQNELQFQEDKIANYSNLVGGVASFYKAESTQAKKLADMQKVMGMAMLTMELSKMGLLSTNAMLFSLQAPPPANFAAFAATAALIASLGIVVGGALAGGDKTSTSSDAFSSMTANTGTGSVLGDTAAQSESISKSIELMGDLAKPEFRIMSEMAKSLDSIDQKIGGVSGLLLRQGGFAMGAGYEGFDTGMKNNIGGGIGGAIGTAASIAGMGMAGGAALGLGSWASMGSFGPVGLAAYAVDQLLLDGMFSKMIGGIMGSVMGGLFGKSSVSQTMTDSGIFFADALLKNAVDTFEGSAYQTISTTVSKKSWFSKSSSTSIATYFAGLDSEVERQFSLVLSNLYDTAILAGSALDTASSTIDADLSDFVVSIGKISLLGKTGDQIQETLSAIFGKIADDIALDVFPLLIPFQKIGEGLFETMTRVAGGMEEAEYYINRLGLAFNDVVYSDLVNKQGDVALEALRQSILDLEGTSGGVSEIIQNLSGNVSDLFDTYSALDRLRFSLTAIGTTSDGLTSSMLYGAGGIQALDDATQTYIENYLTESEKVAYNTAVMTDAFNDLGLTIPTSKQGFTDLLKGIDVTTESGQDLYGRLILLSEGFNELTDSSDKIKSSLFDNIQKFIDSISGKTSTDAPKAFSDFSASFNIMVDAIANGSSNLLDVGNIALDNAQNYLNTVTATATAGRDVDFAKAMLVNKFSGVIATPDTTLNTINDTLRFSLGESGAIATQLQDLKAQVKYLNDLNTTNTATNLKILSTQRSILGETATA